MTSIHDLRIEILCAFDNPIEFKQSPDYICCKTLRYAASLKPQIRGVGYFRNLNPAQLSKEFVLDCCLHAILSS